MGLSRQTRETRGCRAGPRPGDWSGRAARIPVHIANTPCYEEGGQLVEGKQNSLLVPGDNVEPDLSGDQLEDADPGEAGHEDRGALLH